MLRCVVYLLNLSATSFKLRETSFITLMYYVLHLYKDLVDLSFKKGNEAYQAN